MAPSVRAALRGVVLVRATTAAAGAGPPLLTRGAAVPSMHRVHAQTTTAYFSSHSSSTLKSPSYVNNDVLLAAQQKQTGISLATLLAFGKKVADSTQELTHDEVQTLGPAIQGFAGSEAFKALKTSGQFLHRELPIRLAHRMVELEHLPGGLSDMPSIKQVCAWYRSSFDEIRSHPLPNDVASEESFTRLLASIYERHSPTVVTMARGLVELRRSLGIQPRDPLPDVIAAPLQAWLDIFFLARLGVRTLIAQHIAMHEPRQGYVGIISPECSPSEVLATAAEDAREVVLRHYPDAPDVNITGDLSLKFPYVPLMLRHVAFELLKNSMRATIERHAGRAGVGTLPPVEIIIASGEGAEDVAIKVADTGGGIPRSGMRRIFTYLYTTAKGVDLEDSSGADFSTNAPMAGLGFGLPLSRVFTRYFGGDLQVLSMQGHGTDAYIHLRRLGDASEPLSEASPTISGFARSIARGGSGAGEASIEKYKAGPGTQGASSVGSPFAMDSGNEESPMAAPFCPVVPGTPGWVSVPRTQDKERSATGARHASFRISIKKAGTGPSEE